MGAGVGRSDGWYEGMQRLGGAGYGGQDYLRPSVGAFLTHLNRSVSMYVQCTCIAFHRAIIHQQACSMYIVDNGRSSSAIFLVGALS